MSSTKTCSACDEPTRRSIWAFWHDGEYACENEETCGRVLCRTCHGKHPLFFVNEGDPVDLEHGKLRKFCNTCFRNLSTLDFDRTYDCIPGTSGTFFVFVHGGSGSRSMFHEHAQELKTRFGHGSILLDLPGHGSLMETPLTPDSCVEVFGSVLKECGLNDDNKKKSTSEKVIFVGGSLGAYLGFKLLDVYKYVFDGAVLMDCGQNVGPGASLQARAGLVAMSLCGKYLSNAALTNMMLGIAHKSNADFKLVETVFGSGMFFDQFYEQVECLKAFAPAEHIPNLPFPILYMNGSEDHRDSEDRWLELSVNEGTELKVYEGGDHFFIHDSRFVDDILTRMDALSERC